MAGAIFAFVFRDSGDLEERLSGFAYGFLIPIFFISVGVRFPLDALADTSVLLAAVTIIVVAIAVIAGLGQSVRFYRTVILDETQQDYVRTARAKGLSEARILFRHVLHNAMIPILTANMLAKEAELEGVEDDDIAVRGPQRANCVRSDVSGSAGNKDAHPAFRVGLWEGVRGEG